MDFFLPSGMYGVPVSVYIRLFMRLQEPSACCGFLFGLFKYIGSFEFTSPYCVEGKWDVEWWPSPKSHACMGQGQYLNLAVLFLIHQGHFIMYGLWPSWKISWTPSLEGGELEIHTHTYSFLFNCRRYIHPKMKIPHSKTLWLIVFSNSEIKLVGNHFCELAPRQRE